MADFIHGAEVDEEGFLVDLGDWTTEICETMASDDDVILTDEHWDVLNFLRNYYEEYQVAPAVRVLTKQIKKTMGKEKGNSKYLYALFPYGPGKQGCRFAGLPKPTGCI
jgi:tRNA 2-thiouridine synthesizing protein E